MEAQVCFQTDAILGEGPVWDEVTQTLYWVDIDGKTIHHFNPQSGENQRYTTPHKIGSLALRENGGVIVAMQNGLSFFDPATRTFEHLIAPEAYLPENRMNDGKCDAAGRFWVGTMPVSADQFNGTLYRFDPDLTLHPQISNVGISNGIAWTADNQTMYFTDTLARTIRAFDYELATGDISNGRVVLDVPVAWGSADGMTIDTEDRLWIAFYRGGCVRCWNPRTGNVEAEIRVPAPNVTSCAFGGATLDTLFITTARENMSPEALAQYPLAGSLFALQLPIRGTLMPRFAG